MNVSLKNHKYIRDIAFLCGWILFFSFVLSASSSCAIYKKIRAKNEYSIFIKQAINILICLISIYIASSSKIINITKHKDFFFFTSLSLLAITAFFGNEIKGSKRWLSFAGFSIQPSEILKIFFIVKISSILNEQNNKKIIKSILFLLLTVVFLAKEPDFGSIVIFTGIYCTMLFTAKNINIKQIAMLIASILAIILISYNSMPHAKQRVKLFLDNKTNTAYQTKKSMMSFSEGGIFGKGLGSGTVKYSLPDSHADYIFSLAAEEIGISGCLIIIFLYGFIIKKIISSTKCFIQDYHKSIAYGISSSFLCNVFINIACNLNLIPSKGAVLPLISYGGSSMIGYGISIGLVIRMLQNKTNFISIYDKKTI